MQSESVPSILCPTRALSPGIYLSDFKRSKAQKMVF
jgi:hypothetical protein